MKRAVLYMRVSTLDQHPETQLHDLRQLAGQRGYTIVNEYTDRISGLTPPPRQECGEPSARNRSCHSMPSAFNRPTSGVPYK